MPNSPSPLRTSSIPPSYLKKKERNYKDPSLGIFNILSRSLAFADQSELKEKYAEEILKRLEVWTGLDDSVKEKIKPEMNGFLQKIVLLNGIPSPCLKTIIDKILDLATKAEFELGIMVEVEVKSEQEATEYGRLLELLDYCRGQIGQITGLGSMFPESETPTRKDHSQY